MENPLSQEAKFINALREFEAWAKAYEGPREQGMGAGLRSEMWPKLSPAAQKRMLEIVNRALPIFNRESNYDFVDK